MMGECVQYKGRQVSRDGFRVFVYGVDERIKLVNSWDEFQAHMSTGLWFASKEDVSPIKDKVVVNLRQRKKGRD